MSRDLKNFIRENRHAFDDEQPAEYNWDHIANAVPALGGKKRSFRKMYAWTAAAAVMIIATGIYMVVKYKPLESGIADGRKTRNDIRTLAPEYAASAEPIYQAIEKQQKELKNLSASQPELYDQFTQDLATLDSSYRVLKAQATRSPNREILIKAMMNNLQLQAELLSKQLNVLTEFNNTKTDENEKQKKYSNL
ncbi:MAG: hypothetical protein DI535_06515 [Citrobacter freundii]|nr:MAG: hypothetical protein DI535_06515 [Citrobacter freundii]